MPEEELEATCEYECNGSVYFLTGGTAPTGWGCLETAGSCTPEEQGDIRFEFPYEVPEWVDDPLPEDPPSGQAMYRYNPPTDSLYFAKAKKAPDKKHYLGTVSVTELAKIYPEIAREVEAKKAANPGRGFNHAIPAIPHEKRLKK
jgi:hypothetical protein